MSALGKVYGDFDSNGQLIETRTTPAERVIERSKSLSDTPEIKISVQFLH